MRKFENFTGVVAPLDRANVDTDAIIPKQFLKSIKRTGFGESLFFEWRYFDDGSDNPDFAMNQPRYKDASILVTRNNFGCGSSREHAVWAVDQYGLKVIIAPWVMNGDDRVAGFADIFRNNCGKNSILCVELSEEEVNVIFTLVEENEGLKATVDLEKETITFHAAEEKVFDIPVDPALKHRLLNGLDDIGTTLQAEEAITSFEENHNPQIYL